MQNGSFEERPSHGRSRNAVSGSHNQFRKNGTSNECLSSSDLENGIHDPKSISHGRGRLDERYQPLHSVGNENQMNDDLRGSFRIKFGSIGDLPDGVIGPVKKHGRYEKSCFDMLVIILFVHASFETMFKGRYDLGFYGCRGVGPA